MKYGEQVNYGPETSRSNVESDPERILDIARGYRESILVGQQCVTISRCYEISNNVAAFIFVLNCELN